MKSRVAARADDVEISVLADGKGSLGRETFRGLLWLLFQSFSGRVVGILTQLALARLLLPSQFGVISLVYTVTNIANALVNFGVDGVLLQRHRTLKLWVVPSFWTSLGLGLLGLVTVIGLAPVFAMLYRSPQIVGLATILALSMPLGALATVPAVKLRSDLDFRFLAIYSTFEILLSQAATVVLAWAGFGALSFVLPTPAMSLIKAIVFWWKAPVRLNTRLRAKQIAYLVQNGLSVFGSRLIAEIIAQGDYAVLGLTATHYEVGLYFFAFRLSAQPVWMLAGNFTNVLFPALVQVKAEPERQLNGALRAAKLLSYVVMPVCFLQAALAGPALRLFFGQRWEGSIHLVQLLSIGIPFDAVPWVAGSLLSARREFRRGLVYAIISLPCFLLLVTGGALAGKGFGVALAVAVYYLLLGPIYSVVTFRHYGARLGDVLPLYVRPPAIAAAAMLPAFLLSLAPGIVQQQLYRFVEIALVGPLLYLLVLWIFEPEVVHELLEKFGVSRILSSVRGRFRYRTR